jgi:hypothetical protein
MLMYRYGIACLAVHFLRDAQPFPFGVRKSDGESFARDFTPNPAGREILSYELWI